MDMLVALGLSIGVLIAIWTYLAVSVLSLPVWVGILAWGCFFAAGGKTAGLMKTIAANISGVFWAYIAVMVTTSLGGSVPALSAMVGVVAFAMVLQAKISPLSFIPGAFIGAAATVGANAGTDPAALGKVVIALVAGAGFGFVSEMLATAIAAKKAPVAQAS